MPLLSRTPVLAALAALTLGASVFGPGVAAAGTDELMNQQWGLAKINAPSAWQVAKGTNVRIGIVDSGVDLGHPDLAGHIVAAAACVDTPNGSESECREGAPAQDIDGHGSHVAGIAAAVTGNTTGVAGTAPEAQLVVARVFKKEADGSVTAKLKDLQAGIRYVVSRGAKVVNLSLGVDQVNLPILGTGSGENPLFDTIQDAWARGALPVVASGNSNQDLFGGSANYGKLDAIIVAATGKDDRLAAYSSPTGNAKWAMAAPGGNPSNNQDTANMILSTYSQGRYAYLAGTSMAAPFVSGAAALLFSKGLNRQQVVDTLLATADKSVSCGSGCAGRLDAAKAVGAAGGPAPTSPPATDAPSSRAPRTTRATAAPAPVTAAPAPSIVTEAPPTVVDTVPATTPPPVLTEPVIVAARPIESSAKGASAPLRAAGALALAGSAAGLVLRRRALTAGVAR